MKSSFAGCVAVVLAITPAPTPTPPYGSASRAFVRPVASLLQ